MVSGVRNSCETSDTKRCCTIDSSPSSLICDSMLSAIALKERPSVANSSSPCTSRRTPRSPAASRALVLCGLHDRGGDRAKDDPRDRGDDRDQTDPGDPGACAARRRGSDRHRPGRRRSRSRTLPPRHLELLAHDDAGDLSPVRDGQRHGLPGLAIVELHDAGLELGAQQAPTQPRLEAVQADALRIVDLEPGELIRARCAREIRLDAVPEFRECSGVVSHLGHIQIPCA